MKTDFSPPAKEILMAPLDLMQPLGLFLKQEQNKAIETNSLGVLRCETR
jgi:hypothetical protein